MKNFTYLHSQGQKQSPVMLVDEVNPDSTERASYKCESHETVSEKVKFKYNLTTCWLMTWHWFRTAYLPASSITFLNLTANTWDWRMLRGVKLKSCVSNFVFQGNWKRGSCIITMMTSLLLKYLSSWEKKGHKVDYRFLIIKKV